MTGTREMASGLSVRTPGGGSAVLERWGIDSEYGVLRDVLLGGPESFRWLGEENAQYSALVRETLRRGYRFYLTPLCASTRNGRRLPRGGRGRAHAARRTTSSPTGLRARLECHDAVGAIVTQLANPRRRGEYASALRFDPEHDIPVYDLVSAGNFEGGDFNMIAPGRLLLGYTGMRTEEVAARQVGDWMAAEGIEVHYAPIDEFYVHIDLMVCMLAEKLCAVCLETTDPDVVQWLEGLGIEIVPVGFRETMALGGNVVALGATGCSRRARPRSSTSACARSASPSMTRITASLRPGGGVHARASRCVATPHSRGGGSLSFASSGDERQAPRRAAGGVDEAREQRGLPRVVRQQFGVPLDTEAEAGGGIPQRLDRPVGRLGADVEPGADGVGGLVMEAVDRQTGASGEAVQERPAETTTGCAGIERLVTLQVVERGDVREVLAQRPAARDVQRLHAATDAEQRQIALGRAAQEGELVLVGHAVDVRAELRVTVLPVDGRIEVRAPLKKRPSRRSSSAAVSSTWPCAGRTTARPPASCTAWVYESRSASRGGARSRSLRPGIGAQAGSVSARSSCVTIPISGEAGRGGPMARRVVIAQRPRRRSRPGRRPPASARAFSPRQEDSVIPAGTSLST